MFRSIFGSTVTLCLSLIVVTAPCIALAFETDEVATSSEAFTSAQAKERCNGGSCSAGGGQTLNCPESGGRVCADDKVCTCVCVPGEGGTVSTQNQCL